jgi:hypothetical protein
LINATIDLEMMELASIEAPRKGAALEEMSVTEKNAVHDPKVIDNLSELRERNLRAAKQKTMAAGLQDGDDDDGMEEREKADHTFEFTSNFAVFRLIRMLFTLQFLSILIDNESAVNPVIFRLFCRGPLFYVIRFYSRPFIDAIYILQSYGILANSIESSSSGGRRLSFTSR